MKIEIFLFTFFYSSGSRTAGGRAEGRDRALSGRNRRSPELKPGRSGAISGSPSCLYHPRGQNHMGCWSSGMMNELLLSFIHFSHTGPGRWSKNQNITFQAYPHKILTGRRSKMHTIRKTSGLAGFPKRDESAHDAFGAGHSSTSISAGLGMPLNFF